MAKWIYFGKHILKKCNIDHFEAIDNDIVCTHHLGQKYIDTWEKFDDLNEMLIRFHDLQEQLGIEQ